MNLHDLRLSVLAGFLLGVAAASAVSADVPLASLHERIDRLIDSGRVGPAIGLASDAEFLRRVSLDLTGMPPSSEELRSFLADPSADKRRTAVDRLLASPLHDRQLATLLDLMLMERRPNLMIADKEWQEYLLKACRENRPLNQVLKEILNADGVDPKLRPAARFYLDRGSEPNLITRDVGRIFFGRDIQCSQCHDHPSIDDYRQSDYHGLLAFFNPGYALTRKEGDKDKTFYAEKSGDDLAFDSVFVKNDKHLTGARVLGETELVEPAFPPGEEYQVKPADTVVAVPKFSRRAQLATLATDGTNAWFNENVVNRLWAMMMGRGLAHPLDLMHPANPPSHPEVLKLLADEIVALKFDTKAFLRELALSQTYQRSIDLPTGLGANAAEVASTLAELKTHSDALQTASEAGQKGYDEAVKVWQAAETTLVPVAAEQVQALAKHAEMSTKQAAAQKGVDDNLAKIRASEEVAKSLTEAAAKTQEAVKKLPNEKDLAAASQKFVDRATAITAELAALQTQNATLAAALKKATEEVAPTVALVEAARAKALPLRGVVRAKEQVVVAARVTMAESRVTLERHKKRLRLLEADVHRDALDGQAKASIKAAEARRAALAQSQKSVNDHAGVLAKRTEESKAADQARLTSETAVKVAQAALEKHQKIEKSIVEAFNATNTARELLPDDPTLTDAAQKLKTKADEFRAVSTNLSATVDTASAIAKTMADAYVVNNRRVEESLTEKRRLDEAAGNAMTALADAEARSKALASEIATATDILTSLLGEQFQVAQLKPLSPEQMCWSILKVTDVYDRQRQAEEAELNKSKPLDDAAKNDLAKVRARAIEVEDRVFEKFKANVSAFVNVYGAGSGQPQTEFFATADQALFVANAGQVTGWAAPAAGNIADRMFQEKDLKKAAEDLYMTILSRPPTSDEADEFVKVLSAQSDKKAECVQEWIWGLLSSAEFRFNH